MSYDNSWLKPSSVDDYEDDDRSAPANNAKTVKRMPGSGNTKTVKRMPGSGNTKTVKRKPGTQIEDPDYEKQSNEKKLSEYLKEDEYEYEYEDIIVDAKVKKNLSIKKNYQSENSSEENEYDDENDLESSKIQQMTQANTDRNSFSFYNQSL